MGTEGVSHERQAGQKSSQIRGLSKPVKQLNKLYFHKYGRGMTAGTAGSQCQTTPRMPAPAVLTTEQST